MYDVSHVQIISQPHFVRLGERDLNVHKRLNQETDYFIDQFIVHEKYVTSGSPHNDIALIRLHKNVDFSHHHNLPACLYQTEFEGADFVAVSKNFQGWCNHYFFFLFTDWLGKG